MYTVSILVQVALEEVNLLTRNTTLFSNGSYYEHDNIISNVVLDIYAAAI